MKTKILSLAALAVVGLGLQSCSEDNALTPTDSVLSEMIVPEDVKAVIAENFSNPENIDWDKKSSMYEAEFTAENTDYNVWIENVGTWQATRTVTKYGKQTGKVPQVVLDYVATNYPGWIIEDIDYVRTPREKYYEIELEKNGEPDVTLFMKTDGTLIKEFVEKTRNTGNNNHNVHQNNIPEAVQNTFYSRYPKAIHVKWEREGNMYEVDFIMESEQYEAYIQANGTWVRTEKRINLRTTTLPQPIKDYLAANYAGWSIDDADLVTTPTDEYYEIEIESRGDQDVTLLIRADGTLVSGGNTNPGGNNNEGDVNPQGIPMNVVNTFNTMYPNAIHVEWDREGVLYEAEFIMNGSEYSALFQNDGTWVRTEMDVNLRNSPLPEAVSSYISSNYSGWTIDDVDFIQTPADEYYVIELEKRGNQDVRIRIHADGTLLTM